MGGVGLAQSEASTTVGGAHMLAEGGDVILDSCSVAEDRASGQEVALENAAQWWLASGQSLALRNSSFRSATPGQGLLCIQGPLLQLMIRGCAFENVTIGVVDGVKNAQPIGVVDSTFAPDLDPSVLTVQPTSDSGTCAAQLLGEQVCDARALCKTAPSGGVRCSCVGEKLRYKPGVPEDGRQCEQDASLRAVLESESVTIDVAKPGSLANRTLTLIVEAHGEAELAVSFNVTMAWFEAGSGAMIAVNGSIGVDQPSMSAFGQHVEWKQPPPEALWHANLDGRKFKYADTSRHEFNVRLACDRATRELCGRWRRHHHHRAARISAGQPAHVA
jgi:hypothetical protein